MIAFKRDYRVRVVRGPRVTVLPHRDKVNTLAELREWATTRDERRPAAVDLFCGAGGLSVGLHDAGYDVILGVDNDPTALETYAGLHPGLTLRRDLGLPAAVDELSELICELGVEIIAGGPPCQPFSKAGASKIRSLVKAGVRTEHDDRRDLWQSFLEIVLRVKPPAILLENVPDMAIGSDTAIVRTLVAALEAEGYAVNTALVRACDLGVPQVRQRFFFVALAGETKFDWPSRDRADATLRSAIDDLPHVEGGWRPNGGADGFLPYEPQPEPSPLIRRAREGLSAKDRFRIYDHITRPVRDDDQLIFESMDSTTRYSEIDESLKRYRDDIFDDKYKRLDWDKPSRSITAHIARDGYWYIHPSQPRTLTIREAARLQTFRDHVRFAGPPSAAFRQVGNAVPPLLAERLGRSIRRALRRRKPANASSTDISDNLVAWFQHKGSLALPWLEAPTLWSALQAQLFLGRTRGDIARTTWPTLEKLDSPDRTIESTDQLRHVAALVGRESRVAPILQTARWLTRHPDALANAETLTCAPNVTPLMVPLAGLADSSAETAPVVVTQGSLRVASRVFGLPDPHRRKGSVGRLAVTRLLGGPTTTRTDTSKTAMAAVLELAASLCTAADPICSECPLKTQCHYGSGRIVAAE